MTRIRTATLLSGTALALAAAPQGALAQEADESATDEAVFAPGADDGVIIVTAQRRAQDLQDVPAAVTALSAAQLDERQIQETEDLQLQIPNVVIANGTGTASSARIYFRGIGEDESRGAIDPAVGIYVDNVYLGRTVGSLVDLVDIEQIEVLRGPQGHALRPQHQWRRDQDQFGPPAIRRNDLLGRRQLRKFRSDQRARHGQSRPARRYGAARFRAIQGTRRLFRPQPQWRFR